MSRWAFSRQQVLDGNGQPYAGAVASFFLANTSTPLTVYSDSALSRALGSTVTADDSGRFPFVYLPYGSYREQVATAGGVQLWNETNIDNPAPSGSGGGGGTGTTLSTGDVIWSPTQGSRTGFVRLNGKTIGNAASGASERANADTSNLYTFLWNNMADTLCPVSTGRGATAAADFAANKTLTLLDARAAALMGVSDMGNSSNSGFSGATVVRGSGTAPGSVMGENTHTLAATEIPAHGHTATATSTSTSTHSITASSSSSTTGFTDTQGAHSHAVTINEAGSGSVQSGTGTAVGVVQRTGSETYSTDIQGAHAHNLSATTTTTTTISGGVTTTTNTTVTVANSTGGGGAHNNVPLAVLGTFYQCL